jgi:potassium efflux system protein
VRRRCSTDRHDGGALVIARGALRARRLYWLILAALTLTALPGFGEAGAQEGAARSAGTGAAVDSPSAADAAETPGSEETRAKLAEIEAQTTRLREQAEEWKGKAAEFESARRDAPRRLSEIEREIEILQKAQQATVGARATIEELEIQILGAEQDLALARKEAATVEEEAARRSERRKKIPELLVAAKERLREPGGAVPAASSEAPKIFAARQQLASARRAALEREIEAYQAELVSHDARGQLLEKRVDRARYAIAAHEARIEKLRAALAERQRSEAERAASNARELLLDAQALTPAVQTLVRELAEQNDQLAQARTGDGGLLARIDEVSRKLSNADEYVAEIDADFARLTMKVEAAGLIDSVGLLLRKQRSEAPDVGMYRRFMRMRQQEISAVQLQQIELRDQRRALADIDGVVARAMASLESSLPPSERMAFESLLRELLETKLKYLDAMIREYETYFQKLVDFDARQQELIEKTEQLLRYIDERILWIPSGEALRPELVSDGVDALGWLLAPRSLQQLLRSLGTLALSAPLLNALVVALLLLLLALRARIRERIRTLGAESRDPGCLRDAPTWEAAALSVLLAAWGPGLLAYLGWRLGISPDATQYVRCFADALLAAALIWLTIQVPRQLLRRGGLAEAHFGWPSQAVRSLRRYLSWLAAIAIPAVFVIQIFEVRGEDAWKDSIGRLAFLAVMAALGVSSHRLLRERVGALWCIGQASPEASIRRWPWRLAHALAIAVTVALVAAAVRGYYWTSLQLAESYYFTLVLLFMLTIAFRLSARWSMLARRRLALKRVQEAQHAQEAGIDVTAPVEPEADLRTVSAQTGRLLKSATLFAMLIGLWLIWSDLLPAVGILRQVELWNTTETLTVEMTDAAGERSLAQEEHTVPITLADLCLAILITAMTLAVARNLPGLLEISLLRQLGTSAGERYAYATILKYGITLFGIALACNAIGVGWSNIQWLVAAVGLGLGFGLQEIFANFISGLIILFERPIRVGDTVTIGDVSGTVSRIRIRATWITGFDRKELVVPNKEFVTSRLINWSLSDPVLRVDIPVGIAYGSNTEKALEVLRTVASRNEHILKEPSAQALFLGFGESALNFELRVFSPDIERRLLIQHQLHMAIDAAFREAGIEIAFPQRDLHIRSLPGPQPPGQEGKSG